jgi:hypothetical protein
LRTQPGSGKRAARHRTIRTPPEKFGSRDNHRLHAKAERPVHFYPVRHHNVMADEAGEIGHEIEKEKILRYALLDLVKSPTHQPPANALISA